MAGPFSKGTLTKKLGPLPTWAWGIGVGVLALVAYYIIKARGAVKGAGDAITVSSTDLTDQLSGGNSAGGSYSTTTTIPETNLTWLARAVKQASNLGVSALDAERALRLYLTGEPITTKEAKVVNDTLNNLGLPPDGSLGTPTVIPDAPVVAADPAYVDTASDRTVNSLYKGILGRNAEEKGLNYWSGLLDSGKSTGEIAAAIAATPEAKKKVA